MPQSQTTVRIEQEVVSEWIHALFNKIEKKNLEKSNHFSATFHCDVSTINIINNNNNNKYSKLPIGWRSVCRSLYVFSTYLLLRGKLDTREDQYVHDF